MGNSSPGVRRLCVCVGAPYPGILARACRTRGFGRLYTERLACEDVDLGFASPGEDEAVLLLDLIGGLRGAAAEAARAAGDGAAASPVLAAFHVGITRVEGNDMRGAAVTRITALLPALARAAASGAVPAASLVVGITESLFDDIRLECDLGAGWMPLPGPAADAWCRAY